MGVLRVLPEPIKSNLEHGTARLHLTSLSPAFQFLPAATWARAVPNPPRPTALAPIPAIATGYRCHPLSPRAAFLAAQAPTPTPRASSSHLSPLLGLPMEPADGPESVLATDTDTDSEFTIPMVT